MTAEDAQRPRTLVVTAGGPEQSFRVSRASIQGDAAVASMLAGPWLAGPNGDALAGALGVMIDNVLGSALMLDGPPGRSPVSAEISLDMCRPLPADATILRTEARIAYSDLDVGMATGSVLDGQGRLIALCQQHSRWTASPAAAPQGRPDSGAAGPEVPADLTKVLAAVLRARGGPSGTSSVHVAYTRPCLVGMTVTLAATVAHCGRSLGVVQVTMANQDGKHCALATVVTGAPAPAR